MTLLLLLFWLALFGLWLAVGRSLGEGTRGRRALLVLLAASPVAAAQPADSFAGGGVSIALPLDTTGVQRVALAEALALANETNPVLALARAEVDQAEGRARQAGARPNPFLSGEAIPLTLYGGRFDLEATASASLVLERPSLRAARVEAATGTVRAAEARAVAEALDLAADVVRAYVEAAMAEDRAATLDEVAGVVREAVRSAEFRYAEGELSGFDLRRLRVELVRYETALAEAALDGALARHQLSALTLAPEALAAGVELAPAETFTGAVPRVVLADAMQASRERPELAEARARLEAALAEAEAVRLGRRAPPTVSAGITRQADGGVGPVVGISIPLTVYDRREGDVQAAEARIEAERARLALAERAVETATRRAFEGYDARRQRAALLRGGLLDGADDLLRIAQVAYGMNEISLVELLDATDAYREARVVVAQAEAAAALAYLDLRRATGGTLPSLTLTPRMP